MRVKCLAQEHNTMSLARARTWTAQSGDERTNHEATAPPMSESMIIWHAAFSRSPATDRRGFVATIKSFSVRVCFNLAFCLFIFLVFRLSITYYNITTLYLLHFTAIEKLPSRIFLLYLSCITLSSNFSSVI